MRLKPEELDKHLAEGLAPVYLVSGDEPLLAQEAADAIRTEARARGFTERELFHADAGFDWQTLLNEASALSLFADRKILEVRLDSGKPGADGGRALEEYCANPPEDNLLLMIAPKLDAGTQRSKWVKALETAGVMIQVWPVNAARMPQWIAGRLRQHGIRASSAAVDILADRVEGNLLAAVQEIEKLKLLAPDGEVDADTMSTVVADSARYNVFVLVDKIIEGDAQAAARTLRGLREEGTESAVVLWALARELRMLIAATEAREHGETAEAALKRQRVFPRRIPLIKGALRRLKPAHLRVLLRQAGVVDRTLKGMRRGDPWEELTSLVLSFAGAPTLSQQNVRLAISE